MPKRRDYRLIEAIERVEKDIRTILCRHQATRYFEGIILMYSLIENVLKWLVYVKAIWAKCDRIIPDREFERLKQFCNQQDFSSSLNLALVIGLINHRLYNQIDRIRIERNDIVHQCYLFTHRRSSRVLRAKLEGLVRVADRLFEVFNHLVEETGADASYDFFRVRRKKQMIF
jgi:hypothetical protein